MIFYLLVFFVSIVSSQPRGCFDLPSTSPSGIYYFSYYDDLGQFFNLTNYCLYAYNGWWTLIARSAPGFPTSQQTALWPNSNFGWNWDSFSDLNCVSSCFGVAKYLKASGLDIDELLVSSLNLSNSLLPGPQAYRFQVNGMTDAYLDSTVPNFNSIVILNDNAACGIPPIMLNMTGYTWNKGFFFFRDLEKYFQYGLFPGAWNTYADSCLYSKMHGRQGLIYAKLKVVSAPIQISRFPITNQGCHNLNPATDRTGIYTFSVRTATGQMEQVEMFCDMDRAGGGWTLVARSLLGASTSIPFGWGISTGNLSTLTPYSLGILKYAYHSGWKINEIMMAGSRNNNATNFTIGDEIYTVRYESDLADPSASAALYRRNATITRISGTCNNTTSSVLSMFDNVGATGFFNQFFFRDVGVFFDRTRDDFPFSFGLQPNAWRLAFNNCTAFNLNGKRGLLFVRMSNIDYTTTGTVSTASITSGAVTSGSVTTGTVTTGSVTSGLITTGVVTSGRITTDALTTEALTTDIVTTGFETSGLITTGLVTTGLVTTGMIRNSITTNQENGIESDKDSSKLKSVLYAGIMLPILALVVVFGILIVVLYIQCKRLGRFNEKSIVEMSDLESKPEEPTPALDMIPIEDMKSEDFTIVDIIGKGNFGVVYLALWKGQKVAVKEIRDEDIRATKREIDILQRLNHKNCVIYFGSYTVDDTIRMVMEYIVLGSLKDLLLKARITNNLFSVPVLHAMCIDVASGMAYLESQKIIHRDLAVRNLLVDKVEDKYCIKVSDFGMSRKTYEGIYIQSDNTPLPIRWSAPELFSDWKLFSNKSDVWSFGVVCWEIYEHALTPYEGYDNKKVGVIVNNGERLPKPKQCPSSTYNIMTRCWSIVPDDRPSFKMIEKELEHLNLSLQLM